MAMATKSATGFGPWLLKGVALLGLSAGLLVGADRLVGALRRDVHRVLSSPPAEQQPAAPPAGVQVARAAER